MTLLEPFALFLLPLVALFTFFSLRFDRIARRRRRIWEVQPSPPVFADRLRPCVLPFSLLCLVLALSRPVWDPEPVETFATGQDTVFLVDVSRSMDTVDLEGRSRLDAVKQALLDLTADLQGDRAALVVFAGTTVVKSPMSPDIAFFAQAVNLLDNSAASRGGTLLGDALRQVKKDFWHEGKALSIWVFTDGGDQESFPVEAARDLGAAGVRLHVWGVGTTTGGQVPERGVQSGLNVALLESIAREVPGGTFWGPDLALWNLPAKYAEFHSNDAVRSAKKVVWQEGAWWLLWPAGVLFVLDILLRTGVTSRWRGTGRRKDRMARSGNNTSGRTP